MKVAIKLDKVTGTRLGSGVELAHMQINLEGIDIPERFKYNTKWDVQSTGFGIVLKGNHNIDALRWFLDVV